MKQTQKWRFNIGIHSYKIEIWIFGRDNRAVRQFTQLEIL